MSAARPDLSRTEQPLLTVASVGGYLLERGLIGSDETLEATELGGGVSNVVIAVESDAFRGVVKQSLPRLRVADEWLAKRERVLNEAEALELLGRITPSRVPRVIDVDEERLVVTLERAPDGWRDWKKQLLAEQIDPSVVAALGQLLAAWHAGTCEPGAVPSSLDDPEAFDQLRVDPFYRTLASRRPEVADIVDHYADAMLATRRCLVHGDFSPKNVMVAPDGAAAGIWVLDMEVAHIGDPVFDLAFMLAHLMLKTLHLPSRRESLGACIAAFWDAYATAIPDDLVTDTRYALGHAGCIVMARVDGKSPAEYLTTSEQDSARELGRRLTADPPQSIAGALTILGRVRS